MHIHYLQHDDFEDLAYIGQWAEQKGFSTSCTRFDLPNPVLPGHECYDWLCIMGGKMGAYEEHEFPWLEDEKKFIREAIVLGKIVMGICLGSQLVASALGAKVYPNPSPEIGFFPVEFNKNANSDPVFGLFPQQLTAMHWHNDTFDLPVGAICMASSAATQNQAFRLGTKVFAIQFHFEMTELSANILIEKSGQNLVESSWVQSPKTIREMAYICKNNNRIFDGILDEIQRLQTA